MLQLVDCVANLKKEQVLILLIKMYIIYSNNKIALVSKDERICCSFYNIKASGVVVALQQELLKLLNSICNKYILQSTLPPSCGNAEINTAKDTHFFLQLLFQGSATALIHL